MRLEHINFDFSLRCTNTTALQLLSIQARHSTLTIFPSHLFCLCLLPTSLSTSFNWIDLSVVVVAFFVIRICTIMHLFVYWVRSIDIFFIWNITHLTNAIKIKRSRAGQKYTWENSLLFFSLSFPFVYFLCYCHHSKHCRFVCTMHTRMCFSIAMCQCMIDVVVRHFH